MPGSTSPLALGFMMESRLDSRGLATALLVPGGGLRGHLLPPRLRQVPLLSDLPAVAPAAGHVRLLLPDGLVLIVHAPVLLCNGIPRLPQRLPLVQGVVQRPQDNQGDLLSADLVDAIAGMPRRRSPDTRLLRLLRGEVLRGPKPKGEQAGSQQTIRPRRNTATSPTSRST